MRLKDHPHQERLVELAKELEGLFADDGFHIDGNPTDEAYAHYHFDSKEREEADAKALKAAHARVDEMTEEEVVGAIRTARRALILECLTQEWHEHMLDDCGDDLEAVSYSWQLLHDAYFTNDGECLEAGKAAMHTILDIYHEAPARAM